MGVNSRSVGQKAWAAARALPVAFWAVLALLGGLLFAFLRGKALGRQDEAASRADDDAIARIKALNDAGARGDDAEVQRRVFEGIRPRTRGQKLKGLLLVLSLPGFCNTITPASTLPPTSRCQDRPDWCRTGFMCAPTDCGIELRVELEEARMEIRDLERKSRRLHFDLTCGLGVATVVTQEWDLKAYPTPGACVAGIALRIGK